jgi:hypothetical protein
LQFLLIYRKARAGELTEESGLNKLAMLTEINVEEVGVGGAKNFFEAKVSTGINEEYTNRNVVLDREEQETDDFGLPS